MVVVFLVDSDNRDGSRFHGLKYSIGLRIIPYKIDSVFIISTKNCWEKFEGFTSRTESENRVSENVLVSG